MNFAFSGFAEHQLDQKRTSEQATNDGSALLQGKSSVLFGLGVRARSIWKFLVECLPVLDAAAQKLGPGRNCDILWNRFGKQTPQLRMMPAQIVPATVAVGADAGPQPHHLSKQFFSGPV